ncbi:MAG: hypothetical protein HUU21_03910 [Polyangiaceae bacterium]|nr:hypothetical protein [Polyangiaceae bacterium]
MNELRDGIERTIKDLCAAGDFTGASAAVVRGYGVEIIGFFAAHHKSEEDACEVFSIWSERVLRGLPTFAGQCSVRTWIYTVARNASHNFKRDAVARRRVASADSEAIAAVAAEVRTETRPYLRTEAKTKLAELRDALPPDDRMRLVLRLDKGLDWNDVARVMLGEEAVVDEGSLKRAAQRERKRFQILKERLIEEGRRAGLLPTDK